MIGEKELLALALEAAKRAYAPYSHFYVGAALLTRGGKVYTGCNIENASFSATICAERSAFSAAVSAGEREFDAIAVVGGKADDVSAGILRGECPPCGICRQVMAEFCGDGFRIILGTPEKLRVYSLAELLPLNFGPGAM